MPIVARQRVHFGSFELDVHASELYKHGLKLKLQGHPIQILAMLLERPGELITREEIQQKLWPSESETFVDFEHGLNTAVRKLRQSLGDEAETPEYIETLPRRGYRFVGEVAPREDAAPPAEHATTGAAVGELEESNDGGRKRWLSLRLLAVLLVPSVVLAIVVLLLRPNWIGARTLKVLSTKRLTFSGDVAATGPSLALYYALQSDGRRVYYSVEDERPLRYISASGGNENALPNAVPNPILLSLSPDGSTLLVRRSDRRAGEESVWLMPSEGGAARKLGDVVAQDAAFAPDGKTVVFASQNGIYLTDLTGQGPAKLAEVQGRAFWLRWSPDGKKLRFSVVDPKNLTYSLWELPSNRTPRRLLAGWAKDAHLCCGMWTAKGEYFLFRKMNGSTSEVWVQAERGLGAREPIMLSASGIDIGAVVASPLEQRLFVAGASPSIEVLVRNPQTGDVQSLDVGLPLSKVAYSRDGRMMAATVRDSGGNALWRISADGKEKQQLTSGPLEIFMADYSPDGQRIEFMGRLPDQPWKISWISASGGAVHEISSDVANQGDPSWSPDGQSILYGQPPQYMSETGAPRDLYIYDFRTGKSSKLPGSTGLFSPRWSPDGHYVAAMALDHRSLIVLDLKHGGRKTLEREIVMHPFWSQDSAWVYFNSGEPMTLWRYRVSDRHLEQVTMNIDARRCTPWMALGMRPDGALHVTCVHMNRDIYALEWK